MLLNRITVNDVCGLLLNKSKALEMRLKGKLSRVHFAAVSQAKKENSVKEELRGEHLSVIDWKEVLARQN